MPMTTFSGVLEMKSLMTRIAALGLSLLVAACSGGGNAGTCLFSCPPPGGGVAADLIFTADKSVITNNGSDTVTVTVTAVDANRNAVANVPITLVPDPTTIVTPGGTATDATGKLTGVVGIGADKSNRVVVVKAIAGSLSKTVSFTIQGASLSATLASVVKPGDVAGIRYKLVDATGQPIPGQALLIDGPTPVTGAVTDSVGVYTYTYTAPSNEGTLTITATAAGFTLPSTISVVSTTVPAAIGPVLSASIAANPSNVTVNSTSATNNQVEIRARFVGANNNPIPNVRVRFDLNGDPNHIGGSITSAGTQLYSDADGSVSTAYVAGFTESAIGLQVRACWSLTDFTIAGDNSCANQVLTTVVVVKQAVGMSILWDGKIIEDATQPQNYLLHFAVQVVDQAGQAQAGVQVTPTRTIPYYYKGNWYPAVGGWQLFYFDETALDISVNPPVLGALIPGKYKCPREDLNGNGTLESLGVGQTEDANGNGLLEPQAGDVDWALTSAGSDITDVYGKAYFTLSYGKDKAGWADYTFDATAKVSGTEGHASRKANLPVPAALLTDTATAPPFEFSPYGFHATDSQRTVETVNGLSDSLCNNPL